MSDDALARTNDPLTSHEAAASIDTTQAEAQVIRALKYLGGATTTEVAEHLSIAPWSVSPRMKPLVKKNLAVNSGKTRRGPTGRRSIVWQAI